MPMKFLSRALSLVAAAAVFAASAEAGELRILDPHGLVRATAEIKKESSVLVTLAAPLSGGVVQLSNVNGIAPDIAGAPDGSTVRFPLVPEGVWRVVVPAANVSIKKIEIR